MRSRITRELRAEKAEFDARRLRPLTTGDIGMAVVQFTNKLAQEVGKIVAMIYEWEERGVLVAHRFPIEAIHGG